jgi:hypothetical protein
MGQEILLFIKAHMHLIVCFYVLIHFTISMYFIRKDYLTSKRHREELEEFLKALEEFLKNQHRKDLIDVKKSI